MIWRTCPFPVFCLFLCFTFLALFPAMRFGRPNTYAQVVLDGSLGTRQPLEGPHYHIPAEVGQQRGSNLFHSFRTLHLSRQETATFSGPAMIERIFARVTGGQTSSIDGQLQSTIAGADLFLINPQGILFGPHARLDLQGGGGFYASTADVLRFRDGASLHTDLHQRSTFTSAPPEAFGFLHRQPAAIVTRRSDLSVDAGAPLELIGGTLRLYDSTLLASGGTIRLVSVAGVADIALASASLPYPAQLPLGAMRITGTQATTGNEGGGTIELLAARIELVQGSGISTSTSSARDAGAIMVTATGALTLTDFSFLSSGTDSQQQGQGTGGRIRVTTPELTLREGAFMAVTTFGENAAGTIDLQVGNLTLADGAFIDSSTLSGGAGGSIHIMATGDVFLSGTDASGFFPSALSSGTFDRGAGGTVVVTAHRVITTAGAAITSTSSASSTDDARGGDVMIRAVDEVRIQGPGSRLLSDAEGAGAGGNLTIMTSRLHLRDDAVISAASSGTGAAGSLMLSAADTLRSVRSAITTAADRAGGGNITINAGLLAMRDSRLTAEARGTARSDGGNVSVQAERMVLHRSQVLANANQGNGGNIRLEASAVFLADAVTCGSGQCLSASSNLGVDGTVEISAPVTNISGTLAPLVQAFATDLALLQEPCAERQRAASQSHFWVSGRESVPLTPHDLLPASVEPETGQALPLPSAHSAFQPLVLGHAGGRGSLCQRP